METLAYIHLALADEVPTGVGLPEKVDWRKFSSQALIYLLPLIAVTFGILGMARDTLAQQAKRGDSGGEVRLIQERLQELQYFNPKPTSFFGEITESAVREFQIVNRLRVDGIVGPETEAALFDLLGTLPPSQFPSSPILGEPILDSPSSKTLLSREDVRQLQIELLRNNFNPGPIDGIYGPLTERAVIDFHISRGLPVTGVADKRTLQTLGILQPEKKRYRVIVPGDDNTLGQVKPYFSGASWTYDDKRGAYVDAGSFDNRNEAESWSYWLRSKRLDARVVYF